MRTIVVVNNDLHSNSRLALSPREIHHPDGQIEYPSEEQGWINDCWDEMWYDVKQLVGRKDDLWLVFNGELTDGDHHGTTQIFSRDHDMMTDIALGVLSVPLKLKPKRTFITNGTSAHVGAGAEFDKLIARSMDSKFNIVRDGHGNYTWWHLRMMADGVNFDIAHHTSGGRLPHTRKNAANALAAKTMMIYGRARQPLPHLVLRGHVHFDADSYDNFPCRAMIIPSWQLSTEYANMIAPGDILPIGGAIFICENGKYQVITKYREVEWGEPWHE